MFWGLIIEPHKRYAQTVENSFHVSMACLEVNNTVDGTNEVASVMLEFENQEYILCNLHKQKALQSQLDLNFKSGDKIAFFFSGKSRVYLTGYLIETEDDDDDDDEETPFDYDMDASDEDNEITQKRVISNKPASKRKNEPQTQIAMKKRARVEPENEDDNSDDDDDDDNIFDDEDDDDDEDGDEVDDVLDEDSEDDSDDLEEESPKIYQTPESKVKNKKNLSVQKNKTPVGNKDQKKKNRTPNEKQLVTSPKTPTEANGTSATPSSKKSKKKGIESPGSATPKGAQTPGSAATPQKKTLQGGVAIEDLKTGAGPIAKAGKRVTVYYVGRLKSNNKQFDATMQGPGFKFHLGGGEVIKGWDIGVVGMRVGGKRKIICPPGMAYGDKGSPPVIPPHSTLVFEVELKGVN